MTNNPMRIDHERILLPRRQFLNLRRMGALFLRSPARRGPVARRFAGTSERKRGLPDTGCGFRGP